MTCQEAAGLAAGRPDVVIMSHAEAGSDERVLGEMAEALANRAWRERADEWGDDMPLLIYEDVNGERDAIQGQAVVRYLQSQRPLALEAGK